MVNTKSTADGSFDPTKVGATANRAASVAAQKKSEDFDPMKEDNEDDMVDLTDKPEPSKSSSAVQASVSSQQAPSAVREAPLGGVKLSKENLDMKEVLARQPKESIFIPLEPGEKAGDAFRAVTINGYRCEVKKGVYVELPHSIAELIKRAYNIQNSVFSNHPLNLDRQDDRTRQALNG